MIQRKSFPAQFKAVGEDGTFEAIVSVFGNVDLAGDRVVKGAFEDNLKEWGESGDPIPVIWSHMWDNPDAHIGKVLAAEERDEGLYVKAQIDQDDPFSKKVHKLLKERRVREFSFAYDIVEEEKNDGANELRKLSIIEVGPTLKGMNPDTQLLAAKSGLMGEAFKAALETRKDVYAALEGSEEEKRRAINAAVQAWAEAAYPPDEEGRRSAWVSIAATYDDRVIVSIEKYTEDEIEYVEFSYAATEEGVTLGEPSPVDVTVQVAGKSQAKAGRVLSAKNESKLREARDAIDAVLKSIEKDEGKAREIAPGLNRFKTLIAIEELEQTA